MNLIEWRDEFSVGVASVDSEHQSMIELINSLFERLSEGDQGDSVAEFLGEIYVSIAAHFALEEKLMCERGYDQFQQHKADHERLLDEICDIIDDYEDGQLLDEQGLSDRLDAWFSVHFRTHDARLHHRLG